MNLATKLCGSLIAAAAFVLACPAEAEESPDRDLAQYQAEIDGWADDIARLEALPKPAETDVLLLGSSSIRLWETAAEDLRPYSVVRRGYGGAKYSDLAYYVDRLTAGLEFRVAVVFVGNDIAGRPTDKPAAEVGRLFGLVADSLRRAQPDCDVVCVDVRPTPARFAAWPEINAGNHALRAACESRERAHFLMTSYRFFDSTATRVRDELYGPDRLHLNEAGYGVWRSLIRREIARHLPDPE